MELKDKTQISEEKKLLRKYFKNIRESFTKEDKEAFDLALIENAENTAEFLNSDTLLIYYPLGSEPNLLPLAKKALALGKTVGFPVTNIAEKCLSFYKVTDLSGMNIGAYGICEPSKDNELILDFDNALCIVPALSFDSSGNRLGYGGGYYDRFLSNYKGTSALLIYSALRSDHIPTDIYDVCVDIIITEKGRAFEK